ncbi:MAG: hypothetical protein FWC00_04805 [Firmicutes bacterium]|nr:hypothetical protein [Bacillota bacterium]
MPTSEDAEKIRSLKERIIKVASKLGAEELAQDEINLMVEEARQKRKLEDESVFDIN